MKMSLVTKKIDYRKRFERFRRQALYQSLPEDLKESIREIGFRYRLTFQELRQTVEMAVDFCLWGESLVEQWHQLEESRGPEDVLQKDRLLEDLKKRWLHCKEQETVYAGPSPSYLRKKTVVDHAGDNTVFGLCPVASDRTVCCNMRTIDAVQGCRLACSYCSIQTFYDPDRVVVEKNLSEKLRAIRLNPRKNYHISSGQSSDSLILGNRNSLLDAQFQFAQANPNVVLELKTKSKNIAYLLKTDVPSNVFVSWSLNPQPIIDHEEHLTASEDDRLAAARRIADKGIRVGFHFHPIVHYRGWKNDYLKLIQTVLSVFSAQEVALVSFGTLTFIKPTINSLRLKGMRSKVLQIPMEEASGKLSYPFEIKSELFQTAWEAFKPWHGDVFFYLCMESRELWESVFGFCYANNEAFEEALFNQTSQKLNH